MDSPEQAFKFRMTEAEQRQIFADNARALYGLA
jgi:predicted TIM-barrel fold metal-dependent hydrolase